MNREIRNLFNKQQFGAQKVEESSVMSLRCEPKESTICDKTTHQLPISSSFCKEQQGPGFPEGANNKKSLPAIV